MKKELYAALAVISMGAYSSAQTVSVIGHDNSTIATYSLDQVKEIVFTPAEEGGNEDEPIGQMVAVDLGLDVKWATCNIGANSPEEYGSYFAWGETEVKNDYTEATYQFWVDKNGDGFFDADEITLNIDIAGTEYDVAHVKWGGSWRMPRYEDIYDLYKFCDWEWTTLNGVYGYKVTGPNGNSIFLPAAGSMEGTELDEPGVYGEYWSSTPLGKYREIYSLYFEDYDYECIGLRPTWGSSVRPVME